MGARRASARCIARRTSLHAARVLRVRCPHSCVWAARVAEAIAPRACADHLSADKLRYRPRRVPPRRLGRDVNTAAPSECRCAPSAPASASPPPVAMSASVAFASPPLSLTSPPLRVAVAHDTRINSTVAVLTPRPPRRRVRRVVRSGTVRTRRAASTPPAIRVQEVRMPDVAAKNATSVGTRQSKRGARGADGDAVQQPSPDEVLEREKKQKSFLQEQLELRQKENSARKQATTYKSRRTQKRMRSPLRPRTRNVSNALKDTFQMYMEEISRSDLLGQAQVIELAAHIKKSVKVEDEQRLLEAKLHRRPSVDELAQHLRLGSADVRRIILRGTAAKNTLVSANLRLVTSVARKVASSKTDNGSGIALDDMVQEGSVGLLRAAEKFDASRGYRFSTYATWWIRAYVMRCITTQSRSIKVPSTIVDEYARIRKEYSQLREEGLARPSEEQVAKALGITAAKLRFVVNVVTRKPLSLDLTLGPADDPSGSRSLGEIVEGDDHVEERLVQTYQKQELDLALRQCLRPLERAVIRLRFGLEDGQPRTLRETGELLGLSKERIRQLIFRALPKMKTPEIQRMLTDAASR
ncbi:RNA polymerase sigma-70 [Gracilaria domingensis]|nr:RNA polymerase sigma-70 [Gracilaria domingensis]